MNKKNKIIKSYFKENIIKLENTLNKIVSVNPVIDVHELVCDLIKFLRIEYSGIGVEFSDQCVVVKLYNHVYYLNIQKGKIINQLRFFVTNCDHFEENDGGLSETKQSYFNIQYQILVKSKEDHTKYPTTNYTENIPVSIRTLIKHFTNENNKYIIVDDLLEYLPFKYLI